MNLNLSSLSLLTLFISFFLLSFTFLKEGVPQGHDIFAHLTYAKLFEHELSSGQFPVRWTEGIREGYSQPLFNFYQVGFYYLVSLINLIFPSLVLSIKLAVLFLWGLGTFGTYLFTRKFGTLPASLASLLYLFSPYLILDIFIRSAFPEFMAISFIPLIFWSLERLITSSKAIYIPPLSTFLGVAIISHLPAIIIFFPILILFLLFLLFFQKEKTQCAKLAVCGLLLGIGLSSFYLLPATLELTNIQIEKLKTGDFDFHKNFVKTDQIFTYIWGYSSPEVPKNIPSAVIIILGQWFITSTSFVTLSLAKKIIQKVLILFWILPLLYALFFMHQWSLIVWEKFNFLSFIQFPWRFFMVVPFSSAVILAIFAQSLKKRISHAFLILFILILNFFIFTSYIQPNTFIAVEQFDLKWESWRKDPFVQKEAYFEPGYNLKERKLTSNFGVTPIQYISNTISILSLLLILSGLLIFKKVR